MTSDVHALQVPAGVRSVAFDGGVVVLDLDAQRISLHNATAALLWNEIATGASRDDLVATLGSAFDIPRHRAEEDVDRVIAQWAAAGLVAIGDAARRPSPEAARDARVFAPSEGCLSWIISIGQAHVSIRADPDIGDRIRPWLAHLETDLSAANASLAIARAPDGEMVLLVDGTERFRTAEFDLLMGGVCQALVERSQPATDWLGWMHGAAVARGGGAIALPAPSGSGKSTLVTHLLTRDYRLLTDDLIGLAAPRGDVAPWPMPLSLKPGSWELLAPSYPGLAAGDPQTFRGKTVRLVMPGPELWCAHPVPLRAICFPHYAKGAATELTRLAPLDALQRLLDDRCHLGYPLAEDRVRAFLAVLATIPAFALRYSSLEEARGCLDGLPPS